MQLSVWFKKVDELLHKLSLGGFVSGDFENPFFSFTE